MSYSFDHPPSRLNTDSLKYDLRGEKFGRSDVLPLWVADMDFASPPCIQEALQQRATHPIYGYTTISDSVYESIIQWQQQRHGWAIEKEWIVMLPGVVPGISFAVWVFSTPGEGVLVPTPVYFPFYDAVTKNNRTVVRTPLIWDGKRYCIDFEHLETLAARDDVHLILLSSPHNPGGSVWTEAELSQLATICLRHDLLMISDEIHADLVFSGHHHIPLASLSPDIAKRTITLNSPGKTFNIAGLNTGYAIIPDKRLRTRLLQALAPFHLANANLFGLTALEAAYTQGESWLESLLPYLKNSAQSAVKLLSDSPIRAAVPEGTYLLWLDCQALKKEDSILERCMIEKAGVGLNPGVQFGPEGSGFFRLNFGAPQALVAQGIKQIVEAFSSSSCD